MAERLARRLHPLAWWIWALGLAVAASRTTNLLLLALLVAVAATVVAARRPDAPWARSFRGYLVLGAVVVTVRVGFYVIVGARVGTTEVVRLPEVRLPDWAAGIRLGGPVTLEGLVGALADGLRLATLLACVGAANSLADAKRLLRCVPTVLHEIGTAVVVTLSVAPQLAESVGRVRRARLLRGGDAGGRHAVRTIGAPVLADALERSLHLAASMDARGYGRRAAVPPGRRRATGALVVGGLVGICVGAYGILDAAAPTAVGLPVMAAGVGLAGAGLALGHRRTRPTTYRPDPWRGPEWVVAVSGVAVAATFVTVGRLDPVVLVPALDPLSWPSLPLVPALATLVGLVPARVAPPLPRPARPDTTAAPADRAVAGVRATSPPAPAEVAS